MKAEELRIGNLVQGSDDSELIEVFQLDTDSDGRDRINYMGDNNFDPIPLDEEWLVRFGFKEQKGYIDGWIIDGGFGITNTDAENYMYTCWEYVHGEEIKYVHQLQNLYYALTNQELKEKKKEKQP